VTAKGGHDTITVDDLSKTDVTQVNLDLSGVPGTGVGDGTSDTVIVQGTNAADHIQVTGSGSSFTVSGLHATVSVQGSEATDGLQVDARGGNDVVSAAGLPATTVSLTLIGGDGNDVITGGDGDDRLV